MKAIIYLVVGTAVFTAANQSLASDGCGIYPKAAYGWSDCGLKNAGEQPLWKNVPKGPNRIMRFAFTEGHISFFRFITIIEQADGTGELKVGGGGRRERTRILRRASLSPAQISELNNLAEQSDAWKFEFGSWDSNEIYMHCQLLEMERADAKGYRYASVNIGCNHPNKLMPFVNEVIRLSGLKALEGGRLYQ